ncbi:virion core protein, T7 gp14 family [Roseibium sp. M-1]
MCHPAVVAAISVAGSLAGAAVQSNGLRQQAEANAKAEERRAELANRQKEVNQTQTSFERRRTMERHQQILASNRAVGAERGLSPTGSLVDAMDDTSNEAAQNIEAIRYRVEGERDNLTFKAKTALQRAQSHRQAGKYAVASTMLGGFTNAATTLGGAIYKSIA